MKEPMELSLIHPHWKGDKFLYGSPCKKGFQLDKWIELIVLETVVQVERIDLEL